MPHIVDEVVKNIKSKVKVSSHLTAVILGTSFSDFLSDLEGKTEITFKDVGLKVLGTDVKENKFVFGKVGNKPVVVVLGRLHYNFGYENVDIANLIFILKELGCENLVLTASVGSTNSKMKVGDIVTATDHINLTSRNPLYSNAYDKYGNLFIDMTEPYSKPLIDELKTVAKDLGLKVKAGVVAEFNGPTAETFAESKMMKIMGADFTGFNVCNEVIACKYAKLPVVLFALVTNYGTCFSENKIKHEDIEYNRMCAKAYFLDLLREFVMSL